jgi:predicted RNA-binding Zn ribbon-like protein
MGNQEPTTPTPLAIEVANSWMAIRGHPTETIRTPGELQAWLRQHVPRDASTRVTLTQADLEDFRRLRDAVRSLARAAATGGRPDHTALATLNRIAASTPTWPQLSAGRGRLVMTELSSSCYPATALAAVARDAMALFSGADAGRVTACGAPGGVQFFRREHPRRRWCCDACGNRARVARHYRRHRDL